MTLSTRPLRNAFGQGLLLLIVATLAACGPSAEAETPPQAPPDAPSVRLEEVASGLERPTSVVHAGDGSSRLFIVEQSGYVRILQDGSRIEAPFLDVSGAISSEGEQGLLGLAFHPQYAENGRLFVNYTDTQGDTVIAEYVVSDDPNAADPASENILLTIAQPFSNHNGGHLAFGPDGYLYIGTGDGGAGGDPEGNGQDLGTLLGKMLRIDVDNGDPYSVPEDNPFVANDAAEPEIWAYGLRNPWKYSFDRETGDLWIADVGQSAFEEIDLQLADSVGGENYGWNTMEGSSCYSNEGPISSCDREGLTLPVIEYGRDEGTSVTGGYVYRGTAMSALVGAYVFGDYGNGRIWAATSTGDGSYSKSVLLEAGFPISTFGEDEAGELYVADHNGAVYRVVPSE